MEHAYNQFFKHEAFHQSARARTKVKECGPGDFHLSTKLDDYIWTAGEEKIAHIPEKEQQNIDMEDHEADNDADEELEYLPRLDVFARPPEEKPSGSQEREEFGKEIKLIPVDPDEILSPQPDEVKEWWNLDEQEADVVPDANPGRTLDDRHGQFLIRQLKPEHRRILHEITLAGQQMLTGIDDEQDEPVQRGDISYHAMLLMMIALEDSTFRVFMDHWAPMMGFQITYDQYHEFKLDMGKVLKDNAHITADNFLDVEEPDLADDDPTIPAPNLQEPGAGDPEYKHTIESLNIEDKHIILETDDDKLVECTLKWISMCNKNVQKKIKDSFVKDEEVKEEEEEIVVEEEEDTKEPHVPAECSSEKEESAPPERSLEKEESGEKKTDIQDDETAPEVKPAVRLYYCQDITGNEDDSVF